MLSVLVSTLALSGCINQADSGLESQLIPVTVLVDFGNKVKEKNVLIEKNSNAFQAMQKAFEVEFQEFVGVGKFVTTINGITPQANEFWELRINGKQSNVGIELIKIIEPITISWKLEKIENYFP